MTRKIVYAGALLAFLASVATTIASISVPRWISWDQSTPDGSNIHYTYGLHSRCSSISGSCEPFPLEDECRLDRNFCSMWRSVGFLMSFAVALDGMTLIAFIVMLAGGIQKRVAGKNVITGFLLLVAVVQAASMSIISYVFENDDRFFPGWKLDASWALCTSSWVVNVLTAGGLWVVSGMLPSEGGYELIPERTEE